MEMLDPKPGEAGFDDYEPTEDYEGEEADPWEVEQDIHDPEVADRRKSYEG